MGLSKISSSLVCLLAFALVILVHPSNGQDAPQDYLDAHNNARAEVGVGPMTWDDTAAAYAQNYANQRIANCDFVHSGGPYGENIASSNGDPTGYDAVKLFVDEKVYYDYDSNSCVGGECLHYTQVVWRASTQVGCAKGRCDNGWTFTVCNYNPRGNIVGQRPY